MADEKNVNWLAAVKNYGVALEYVPEALKTEAVCFAAVKNYGVALEYVPEALKTEAVCFAALNGVQSLMVSRAKEALEMNEKFAKRFFSAYVGDDVEVKTSGMPTELGDLNYYLREGVEVPYDVTPALTSLAHGVRETCRYFNTMIEKFNKAAKYEPGEGLARIEVPVVDPFLPYVAPRAPKVVKPTAVNVRTSTLNLEMRAFSTLTALVDHLGVNDVFIVTTDDARKPFLTHCTTFADIVNTINLVERVVVVVGEGKDRVEHHIQRSGSLWICATRV